ncbi:hypothetical protein QFZ63_002364 [Streptomyces sp. B3I7]|uniref:hypothetical protein n=1 Tax=unclassified Streptomyces TaxID=2593676 RepID=UPI0027850373|nr:MULTISPECIES: hypothetical protein [unclassified Streptomyces]MDQ0789740.1 hypothetical protein [Streptomyces sp. B3I8]MDQ0810650.1 hypothetical protein [Streptomyces sp. B3I7]
MPSTHASPHRSAPRPARRRETALERRGLALRFVLIIGDQRLAEAHHILCDQDTVVVDFPESTVRIGLSRLLPEPDGGVVLDCRVQLHDEDGTPRGCAATSWQRVLTGRPGALHQREALLREVVAARSRVPDRAVARPRLATVHYLAAAV